MSQWPSGRAPTRLLCIAPSWRVVSPSDRVITSRYCVKTKKASVVISSPSGSHTVIVFWCQIHHKIRKGSPRAGTSNNGGAGKISSFLSLSLNISKTVAYQIGLKLQLMTNRKSHRLSIDTKIDDLGWPWTAVRQILFGIRDISRVSKANR